MYGILPDITIRSSIRCILQTSHSLQMKQIYSSIIFPYISYAILAWGSAYKTHINKVQTKQNHPIRLIFFAQTFGYQTDSALPLLNLLDVLTVNNVYRLHVLKFTNLWHKIKASNLVCFKASFITPDTCIVTTQDTPPEKTCIN